MDERPIRLPGSGTVPRAFAFAVLVIVTVFVIVWLISDQRSLALALVLEALVIALAIRSLFVGVLLVPGAVLVRAWFRTHRYARGELRAVVPVPYWKFLGSEAPALSLLKFTPERGWVREVAATVAWRDRTAAHAARIREHLGIEAPPE
jgi:hypothetical protein